MKKTIMILTVVSSSFFMEAQGDTAVVRNKRGHAVLPAAGDIALGFNTIPVLDVLFRAFNFSTPFTTSSDIVQYTSAANNQITGKYFIDSKTALRVRFGINTLSGSTTSQVQDAAAMHAASLGTADDRAAASLLRVEDSHTFRKSNHLLSVGLEKRRGYRRLQGFYGAELAIGTTAARQSMTYGNAFSDVHDVVFTDFNSSSITTVTVNPVGPGRVNRTLETRHRGGIRFGVRGFIGIEYFVFAKISIAAEYGWAYSITTRRAATSTREVYNNGQNGPAVFTEDVDIDSREVLRGFAIDNNSGSVFSMNNTIGGNTALSGGAGALTIFFHF